jgi:PAS domain S-box-containing protein
MSADKIEMRSRARLLEEIEELRTRLEEAEQTLQAIRSGEVDALVVEGPQGAQVFSLTGVESVYRAIVETMNEAALTVSPQGMIIYCNQRFSDLIKKSIHEVVGRKLTDFVEMEHHTTLVGLITQAQIGPSRGRLLLRSADGNYFPTQISASLLNTATTPCFCIVASDLTQLEASADLIRFFEENQVALKASQENIQESERKFRALFENSFDAVFLTIPDGLILAANPAACTMTGWTEDELCKMGRSAIMDTNDPRTFQALEELRRTGHIRKRELTAIRKDRQRIPVEVDSVIIPGDQVRSFVIMKDITERKEAEIALEQSERCFRTLTEKGGELITVLDASGTITLNIAGSNTTLGYTPEELIGRNAFELAHPNDLPHLLNLFHEGVLQPGRIEHAEFRLRAKDGSWRWQLAVGTNLLDDPAVGGILINSRDITERKEAEEKLQISEESLRQANQLLEERVRERTAELEKRAEQLGRLSSQLTMAEQRERKHLAQILHDGLQQYLVAAKMQVGGLIEQAPDDALKQAAVAVDDLLNESVKVSRSLATELSPRILHETGLLAGLEWLSRWMSDKHGLKVELVKQMNAPVLTEDVKVLVYESVKELLLNVAKHAETHSARVSLAQEDGRLLQITVSDDGVGFDPAGASVNDESFGLFSIRERLGLIGGRFEADSAPGNGARFTLRVPLVTNEPVASIPRMQPVEIDPTEVDCSIRSDGKVRILLTDDHAVMREGLARLLGHEPDFEVVGQASDGQEAVELAGKLLPDVILMDIGMPHMNGLDATRVIHQRHPDIRIIGLSFYKEEERSKAMLDSGAVFYLTKSGPPAELKVAIRSCMKEKSGAGTEHAESLPLKI